MLWQLKFNIYLPSEKPNDIAFIQGFQYSFKGAV